MKTASIEIEPLGDDGETWLARGHVSKRAFCREWGRLHAADHDREWWPTPRMVAHKWAILMDGEHGEVIYRYVSKGRAPGFPVTVYSL